MTLYRNSVMQARNSFGFVYSLRAMGRKYLIGVRATAKNGVNLVYIQEVFDQYYSYNK